MTKRYNKLIFLTVITLTLLVFAFTGVLFAYYQTKEGGWPQRISLTEVVFKFNDKTLGNTVNSEALGDMARGEAVDLDLELSVTSDAQSAFEAYYNVTLSLVGESNGLSPAIEVYSYRNGDYVYECRLSDVKNHPISGAIAIEQGIGRNNVGKHRIRLVYSATAGLSYEGEGFTLFAEATSEISKNSEGRYFVRSSKEMADASGITGKTITLLNDVVLNNDIVLNGKTGLDLNGYTLNLGGSELTLSYSGGGPEELGIVNDAPTGGVIGTIVLRCPDDFVYVQDSLAGSVRAAAFSKQALTDYLIKSSRETEKTLFVKGDTVPVFKGALPYIGGFSPYLDLSLSRVGALAEGALTIAAAPEVTSATSGYLYLEAAYSLPLNLRVRGDSPSSIAEAALGALPETVEDSLFLPVSDTVTGAALSWESGDSRIVDENGAFLPLGAEALEDWRDRKLELGVIVDNAGEQTRAVKTLTARIMSAKERTDAVYSYGQIILYEEGERIEFVPDYLTDAVKNNKTGLSRVTIAVTGDGNVDDAGNAYLGVEEGGGKPVLTLLKKPETEKAVKVSLEITFVYDNAGDTLSFTVNKDATLVGFKTNTELSDLTAPLQQEFLDNIYVKGAGFEFYVGGSSKEYTIEFSSDANYLLFRNGEYYKNENGEFLKRGDEYFYIEGRYNLEGGGYVPDADGAYIYVGGEYLEYEANKGSVYAQRTLVKLLPALLPCRDESAAVSAFLYTVKNGVKQYVTDEAGERIVYYLTLDIRGIYHNTADEIADTGVYNILLDYYDLNGDGWISTDEAVSPWFDDAGAPLLGKPLSVNWYTSNGKISAKGYIDFTKKQITSLKGLEYFTGAEGLEFGTNRISDLSPLSALSGLIFLGARSNDIASLGDLAYLDELEYLDLAYNLISDLSPIEYLTGIGYLDLSFNDAVTDVSPLFSYDNLFTLDVRQAGDLNTNSQSWVYYMTSLYDLNRANNITIYMSTNGSALRPSDVQIAAARILGDLLLIDTAYTTLNVPLRYNYLADDGTEKVYSVRWSVISEEDKKYLDFTYDAYGNTTGYRIINPAVNKEIGVIINVKDVDSADEIQLARSFYINLLKGIDKTFYVEKVRGTLTEASEAIPDPALLSRLVELYNNRSGTVTAGGAVYDEQYVLSYDEIYNPTYLRDIDLSGSGVLYLKGLELFAAALDGRELNLGGIVLSDVDYEVIKQLTGLRALTLLGARYDFGLLLNKNGDTYLSPFTGLKVLNVYGSYGLNGDDLAGLYRLYLLNPQLDIYKDSEYEIWNPYAGVLSRYKASLPSAYGFRTEGAVQTFADQFGIGFYGVKTLYFSPAEVEYFTSGTGISQQSTENFVTVSDGSLKTGIRYVRSSAYDKTVYARLLLSAGDGRQTVTFSHYVRLNAEINRDIYVTDADASGSYTPLYKLIPGRSLLAAVLGALTQVFEGTPAGDMASIGGGYYRDGDKLYITAATLAALELDSVTVDGCFSDAEGAAVKGLRYLPVTELTLTRDASLGDGSELINLVSLTISNSGVDFSGLDRVLPKLTSLYLGKTAEGGFNRFVKLYGPNAQGTEVYYLSNFPSLVTLGAVDCNLYDFNGLKGLIGNANFKNLSIYGTDSPYSNYNSNYIDTVNVVAEIYGAAPDGSKYFYIGNAIDGKDASYRYEGVWEDVHGVTSLDPQAAEEYNEFAPFVVDAGLKIQRASGSEYYFNTNNDTVIRGERVLLPATTKELFFDAEYVDSNYADRRDFAVDWRIAGITVKSSEDNLKDIFDIKSGLNGAQDGPYIIDNNWNSYRMFDITPSTTLSDGVTPLLSGGTYSLELQDIPYDFYLLIVGTIGRGYYDGQPAASSYVALPDTAARYSFVYPLLLKGRADYRPADSSSKDLSLKYGAYSYSIFEDPGLRFNMYMAYSLVKYGYSEEHSIVNGFLSEVFTSPSGVEITGLTYSYNNGNSVTFEAGFGGSRSYDMLGKWPRENKTSSKVYLRNSKIANLNGADKLKTLTKLSITDYYLGDISGLYKDGDGPTGLTDLTLSKNYLRDVSVLKNFPSLKTVNLSYNAITRLADNNGVSVLSAAAGTLTSLDISYNALLSGADIAALAAAAPSASGTAFGVNFAYTAAQNDVDTYRGLKEICNKRGLSTLKVGDKSLDAAEVSSFIDTCYPSDDTALNDFSRVLTRAAATNTAISITTGGYSYTGSFVSKFNGTVLSRLGNREIDVVMVVSNGKNITVRSSVRYYKADAINYSLDVGGKLYQATDFDSGLWAYLTNNKSASSEYVITFDSKSLSITSDWGITSLNGLNLLTTVTSVNIVRNEIVSLWQGDFASLTELTLNGARFDAAVLRVIAGSPNLKNLNLRGSWVDDYLKPVEMGGYGSPAQYLAKNTAITDLGINNDLLYVYSGVSTFDAVRGYTVSANPLFGVPGGRALSTFNFYGDTVSAYSYALYASKDFYNADPVYVGYAVYADNAVRGIFGYTSDPLGSVLSFASGMGTATGRTQLLPDSLSLSDIETEAGVGFELPESVTYFGRRYAFAWFCDNSSYIADGKFVINADLYAGEDSVTLAVTSGAYRFSKTVQIKKFAAHISPGVVLPDYYIKSGGVYLPAGDVFDSGNLIYALFNNCGLTVREYSLGGVPSGSYIDADAVRALTFADRHVTTIRGIGIFGGLTSLTVKGGHITDLSPLESLHLKEFVYENSDPESEPNIVDFEPLARGSRDTLTLFSYAAAADVTVGDLSFLAGFTAIENIILGGAAGNNALLQYMQSSEFAYLLGWLSLERPAARVMTKYFIDVPFNTESVFFNNENYSRLLPTNSALAAVTVMSYFKTGASSVVYTDNYRLTAAAGVLRLPAYVDAAGRLYPLSWRTDNQRIGAGGYLMEIVGGSATFTLNGTEITYLDGDVLSFSEAEALFGCKDFALLRLAGQVECYQLLVTDAEDFGPVTLICVTEIGGYPEAKAFRLILEAAI